jgi:hypothetical protein
MVNRPEFTQVLLNQEQKDVLLTQAYIFNIFLQFCTYRWVLRSFTVVSLQIYCCWSVLA